MSELEILSKNERRSFDKTPSLSRQERQLYFRLDSETKAFVSNLKKPINRVGFVLQLGYFKAMGRFYPTNAFKKRDINYVNRMLGYKNSTSFELSKYTSSTYYRHQEKIQSTLDWQPFDSVRYERLLDQANHQASLQRKPKHIFGQLIDFCWKQQITIPSYTELAELVTKGFLTFENTVVSKLTIDLGVAEKQKLDELLDHNSNDNHPITTLKHINQSLKPRALSQSVALTKNIADYYNALESVIEKLSLSDQAIEYFATWVQRARTNQLTGLADRYKSYLHLLSYFKHQYYSRQDALTAAFMKCVGQSLTTTTNRLNKQEVDSRNTRNQAIKAITKNNRSHRELLNDIRTVSKRSNTAANEKYYKIESLLKEFDCQHDESETNILIAFEHQLITQTGNDDLYKTMEGLSRALQLRVGPILKVLIFNEQESDTQLIKAINYFKHKDGKVTESAPMGFLKGNEQDYVLKDNEFNVSLFKFLLFAHVADGIKSGNLNLKCSYRYKAISDYLINKQYWELNRDKLIKAAGLEKYEDIDYVIADLKKTLDTKYQEINQDFADGNNPYLNVDSQGRISIKTPKTDYDTSEFNAETLEQGGIVSIQQVMSDINRTCDFSSAFSHLSVKHSKLKPKFNTIAAGIIGLGCNIGLNKLANISLGVSENTLRNTVNWCFDMRNITEANQLIVKSINDLVLAKSYVKNTKRLHSSSDGRKVGVGVDSLMATRSFKYFGKDQGVVIYTFIDERQALYHSTVISASDREAPYVIDGLMQNNPPHEVIHSVDEHGWSEAVHGATHLFGASFAPRFKRIGSKTIYGFSTKKSYKKKGYKITPSRPINQNVIRKNWDDILRFMATIKLNYATASQLFKRLSSYAKETPLYKALKEFGRIIKSIYVLTYCSDVELRQDVQKNLNRIELSNKFSHAVFFDNDQEFHVGEKEEQELATVCKILIQNAIVLWNYLALSELIVNTEDAEDAEAREELIDSIHRGSVLCWRHINLRGTYDFRKQSVSAGRFNMKEIGQLEIA